MNTGFACIYLLLCSSSLIIKIQFYLNQRRIVLSGLKVLFALIYSNIFIQMLFIFLHIFCYDAWFYVSHIILHKPKIYGLIHNIHHSTPVNKLDYMSTHIAHYAENIVQPLGIIIPCFIVEYNPAALVTSFIVISIRGMLRHDDRFSWLIGNHHLLHHKHVFYNFGEYWIDCLCGTCYPNKKEYVYGKTYT